MFGREIAEDPALSFAERWYIRLLGAPVQGLRVRARYVLPHVPGGVRKVLDVGCGRGAFVLHLARRGHAFVAGMDLDADRLRRARVASRRLALSNAHWFVGDILCAGLRGGFDVVLCVDNLEHIDDDAGALSAMRECLADGGRLVLHVPSLERRWPVFAWKENFDAPGHVRPGYDIERLRALLLEAGFRIEHLRPTYGVLENLANNISYMITQAREKNRALYALVFPILLFITFLGRGAHPSRGAGILAVAAR